jgi:hypothetical protein
MSKHEMEARLEQLERENEGLRARVALLEMRPLIMPSLPYVPAYPTLIRFWNSTLQSSASAISPLPINIADSHSNA